MPLDPVRPGVFERLPRPPAPAPALPVAPQAPPEGRSPFLARLTEAVQGVDRLQHQADRAAERLATGEADSIHDAVIALEKADLALQLTVQVTQKAVDAYREVSRMQV